MTSTADVDATSAQKWAIRTCTGEILVQDPSPPVTVKFSEHDLGDAMDMNRRLPKAVFGKPDNLWENGKTITYAFLGGTANQQAKVRTVLSPNTPSTWVDYANVKFQHLPPERASSAIVRIQFQPGEASWAYVGQEAMRAVGKTQPTMNLGWIGDDEVLADAERGVVLHEFGHVLGMLHEHQSPARGGITLKVDAIKELYTKRKGWSEEQVQEQILRQYNQSEVTNYTKFDRQSIMMYYMPKEMNAEGIEIPPNDALSPLDKAFATIHYPYFGDAAKQKGETADIRDALEVLGLVPAGFGEDDDSLLLPDEDTSGGTGPTTTTSQDDDDGHSGVIKRGMNPDDVKVQATEEIMALYADKDWVGMRKRFSEVYATIRAQNK